MTADELRERLARLETVQGFSERSLDQHAMILKAHSARILANEQNVLAVERRTHADRVDIERLKKSDAIVQQVRARQKFIKDGVKWIAGFGVLIAVAADAMPTGAGNMLRGMLGLP
jgi:hypothetical protein